MQQNIPSYSTHLPLLLATLLRQRNLSSSSQLDQLTPIQLNQIYDFITDDNEPLTQHQVLHNIKTSIGLSKLTRNDSFQQKQNTTTSYPSPLDTLPPDTITYMLSRCPKRFYKRTRLLLTEFWTIYMELENAIKQPRGSIDNQQQNDRIQRGRPRLLHPADELLLWFLHSDGVPTDIICWIFDDALDNHTIISIADHITSCINSVYEKEIEWPDAEERRASYGLFSIDEHAIAILDGTHCEIEAPVDLSTNDELYSGHKLATTQSYLVWCNALGFILKVEGPFVGRLSDRGTYSTSEFAQPDCKLLSDNEKVIADGGFWGEGEFILPARIKMINTAETKQKQLELVNYNLEIQDNRALIEHQIHFIKDRARALNKRYSRGLDQQADLFLAASKLLNRIKRIRICNYTCIGSGSG